MEFFARTKSQSFNCEERQFKKKSRNVPDINLINMFKNSRIIGIFKLMY